MRRGRTPVVAITLVIFLGVAVYMGYYIASAFSSRISTAEAVAATAEDTVTVSGWFARDEYELSLSGGADEIVAAEGEKVTKGQTVAVAYADGSAKDVSRELAELRGRLDRLKTVAALTPGEDIAKVEADVTEYLCAVSYAAGTGEYSGVGSAANSLKAAVLRRDYVHGRFSTETLKSEIATLESRISVLGGQARETTASLRAPASGYFSAAADGYESVLTYDGVLDMTPSELDALAYAELAAEQDCCGKLSTSFAWRFAAAVSEAQAKLLSQDSWYTLRFSGEYIGEVQARLYKIGEPEDGRCSVVFSGSRSISELLSLRRQNVEIILTSYSGLRVPKSAIRIGENGENGVYILLAAQARFVPVEQIYEADNYYIVTYDSASKTALRTGDEIIVRSKELYDGKVVE